MGGVVVYVVDGVVVRVVTGGGGGGLVPFWLGGRGECDVVVDFVFGVVAAAGVVLGVVMVALVAQVVVPRCVAQAPLVRAAMAVRRGVAAKGPEPHGH